jgi:hypothetical protein
MAVKKCPLKQGLVRCTCDKNKCAWWITAYTTEHHPVEILLLK